ncbi:hypothetical protein TGPRC2_305540 [Toxoplasma gondii TgCatPRC2]|uniref:Domain of unknown function at the cortex 1 domain-containing protein n=2 Tax=Toxoplasma gondii TaxID=5811 RepID=A0A151H5D6_TOXGO|nr:hypothetical protein TGARI_305540 [Toxoplasma gondii ARI]KYK64570.1 hypothetical protein TGPRC2_305540 [Toxoplasma gondii TgCatPRC2]
MEETLNSITSYLRNVPLTSISDPLAVCSTAPALPERENPSRVRAWVTRSDFHGEATPTMGGTFPQNSGKGGEKTASLSRNGSSLSDAIWSFHENLRRQWSQLQILDQPGSGRQSPFEGKSEKSESGKTSSAQSKHIPGPTSPGSAETLPRAVVLSSPTRQAGFLSSTSCASASPAAGDADFSLHDDDSVPGSPVSPVRHSASGFASRKFARCLAAAAPGEDRVAVSDLHYPAPRDFPGRVESRQSSQAKPVSSDTAKSPGGATRTLAEAYMHLRVENRTMWMSLHTLRVVVALQLALSVLGFLLNSWPPGFSAQDAPFRSAVFWLHVAAYMYTGWCLYTLRGSPVESWEAQQARETVERLRQNVSLSPQVAAGSLEGAGKAVRLAEMPVRDDLRTETGMRDECPRRRSRSSHARLDRERIPPPADAEPPPVETWPQRPVFLRATEEAWIVEKVTEIARRKAKTKESSRSGTRRKLPIVRYPRAPMMFMTKQLEDPKTGIHWFENPFFRGVAVIRLAPVGGSPGGEVYTDSKKRYLQACFQGQFLQPHRVGEVLTGQVFSRRLKSLPPRWMVNMGMKVVKQLTDTLKEDISSNEPYFLTPALCVAQTVHVAHASRRPRRLSSAVAEDQNGMEERRDNLISDDLDDENFYIPPPDPTNPMIQEDTRLLGGPFSCGGISSDKRKRLMGDRKLLKELVFSPDYIYTFDFFQNIFYPSSYEFDLGVMRLDLAPYLNRQPIELMALVDDSFIRDGTPSSSTVSSDKGGVSSSCGDGKSRSREVGGEGGAEDNATGSQGFEDEDVSKWKPPPGSWKFLWRYQMWHEKLLSN